MTDMQTELQQITPGRNMFSQQRRMSGRWGIDAASSWTARGLGYSPDEQNMPAVRSAQSVGSVQMKAMAITRIPAPFLAPELD
jgi:hypothetical protein